MLPGIRTLLQNPLTLTKIRHRKGRASYPGRLLVAGLEISPWHLLYPFDLIFPRHWHGPLSVPGNFTICSQIRVKGLEVGRVYIFPPYLNSLPYHQNPVNGILQWPTVIFSSKQGPGGLKTTAEGSPKPLTFSPVQRAPKGTWLLGKGHLMEVMETCVQVSALSSCVTLDRSLALSDSQFPHL